MSKTSETSLPPGAPNPAPAFSSRISVEQVDEGHDLAPKFDSDDLIACVNTDAASGEVLMRGYEQGRPGKGLL